MATAAVDSTSTPSSVGGGTGGGGAVALSPQDYIRYVFFPQSILFGWNSFFAALTLLSRWALFFLPPRFSCQLYLGAPPRVDVSDDPKSREALNRLLENQTAKIYATLIDSLILLSEEPPEATAATLPWSSTTTTAMSEDDAASSPASLLIGHAGTGRVQGATQLLVVPLKDWSSVLRQQALSWMHVVESADTNSSSASTSVMEQLRGLEYTLLTQSTNLVLQVHPDVASAVQKGRKVEELADDPQFSDDGFLNTLQGGVSEWIGQIKSLIQRTKAVPPLESSAGDEVRYWVQLHASLQDASDQLGGDPGVVTTLGLLRFFKRFVATRTLETLGLESALAYTGDVVHFLKPLPIDKLASSKDFSQLSSGLHETWTQLHRVRQSRYPLDRAVQLGLAVTRLARDTLMSLLNKSWMFWDYADYERDIYFPCHDILVQLNEQWDDFRSFVSEQAKRRKVSVKTDFEHAVVPLEKRLHVLHEFRLNHERLVQVLKTVQVDQVEVTPRQVLGALDVLDLSPKGHTQLDQALEDYAYQMEALEERLAKLLRDKLAACHDAEDMFGVFARFHLLLTRPRVRAAVKEFQIQLITTVASAIQKLQSKFVCKYEDTPAARVSRLRGIPPVSGKILWALQMERQVHSLMAKMENVLGKNWGQELEGRQLKKAGDELLAKLDAKAFFRKWVLEWEKQVTALATSRFHSYPIVIENAGTNLYLRVNFDDMHAVLASEIRHLKFLGFKADIPRTLTTMADEAVARYPHAVAIQTAISSYQAARAQLTSDLAILVKPELVGIRKCVSQAFGVKLSSSKKQRRVRWQDSVELTNWVSQLVDAMQKLEDRVEGLLSCRDRIQASIAALDDVEYDSSSFQRVLADIQKVLDEMSLSGYADLDKWVQQLSTKRIGTVLAKRLHAALQGWIGTFGVSAIDDEDDGDATASTEPELEVSKRLSTPTTAKPIQIDIILRNQEISSSPTMPSARSLFFNMLHDYIGVVCGLPRPKSGRYEVFDSATPRKSSITTDNTSSTFSSIIYAIPSKLVADAYAVMERHIYDAAAFVDQWLAYQSLWDAQVGDVTTSVGADVSKWQVLLLNAAQARSTLDSAASVAEFGPFVIKFGKVQSQINLKYDSWQKDLQGAFASILGQCIAETHEKIVTAKARLEATTLDSASTENIVLGVTFIQEVKQKVVIFKKEIDNLTASEKLLKKQRYAFHSDWLETSVVSGLYDALLQILDRRARSMEQQIPVLQARVAAEDKTASKQLSELLKQWEQDKPLRGNKTPPDALDILTKFEISLKKANVHRENLVRAKDALDLDHSVENTEIVDCIAELSDLKEVWEAVMAPFAELEAIKDTPWATAVMRKVKRSLDDLLAGMRSLPNRIRQYDAYVQLHEMVKSYIAGHGLLSDLKTEALKERHWKSILQRLGIHIPFTDLSIGVLWDNGVLTKKKDMVEILTIAQGEMALEVFLAQVRDRWTKQELDLVLFQNRTRLIRGWDELFATLDDHISGLALMKSSPYYRSVREFQEEGKVWEDRLTKLRTAFDSWVDVQRRWVYLEGIFFGSSDIKAQLPGEWSRFKSVDSEFVALMRRIAAKPYAMEVLNVDNLQRTLERLASVMSVVQRALGEYLAKQRSDFSRFYFLGDDDLLEIMGSGEPGQVLAHVGKMFAGIAGAKRATENLPEGVTTRLEAIVSKDGEVVPLRSPIDITMDMNVKDWLKALEYGMQDTVATLLEEAVREDSFTDGMERNEASKEQFIEWTTKFPAQVMILAAQINWSMGVDRALLDHVSSKSLASFLRVLEWKLEVMATTILKDLPAESRKKFEQLITELVRQRDVVRQLIDLNVSNPKDFRWLYHLRYHYNPKAPTLTEKLTVMLSNAKFCYGFEYLGIGERLVQTPLTDKCYLTLTQALHFRLGGSPFGPAGTGKTESVKALGAALGRFVLVFNCDETFDYSAMGRLLAGLTQVGAWGCFDEFNRLEERILSAVSQQVLTIQRGLLERHDTIELLGRQISLHENVGIFITMNPGYEGRSNLPDNLKALFRSFAMVVPDRNLIAQVMLYSQGIVTAEQLAGKIVELFLLCEKRMSKQRHYDFGLRALKTLLVSAGALKRQALEGKGDLSGEALAIAEENALIVGACNNVLPKLVAEDMPVFKEVLDETFPGSAVAGMDDEMARAAITSICIERSLVPAEQFIQKILQLKQILEMRHGVMIVGRAGKSAALRVLLQVLEKIDGTKGEMYVIDPKAISKDRLYGSLDGTTLEWTDGVFTCLLRRIIDNQKGEAERRHWIVFDGDIDVSAAASYKTLELDELRFSNLSL
jgi:dynein heavy chain 1